MRYIKRLLFKSVLLALCLCGSSVFADNLINVPILTYHNFDPSTSGDMTLSTERFEEQLKWIKDNGYTVIPLKDLVDYLLGHTSSVPEKSVVITADDGRKSIYTYVLPLARKYNIPITLFIYPTSISNAPYAMTWEQLKELQETGLFDVQGHTYWHPNFKQERKRLGDSEYQKLVDAQFISAKKVIDKKLGTNINLLAWPYGIYNDYLEKEAAKAGYIMAFSIDARPANRSENMMSQPRYMIVAGQSMKTFAAIVSGKMLSKKSR
jgi:peptidoglycan/xylan/chitin deacetylase (PgdA/CDA1 family)